MDDSRRWISLTGESTTVQLSVTLLESWVTGIGDTTNIEIGIIGDRTHQARDRVVYLGKRAGRLELRGAGRAGGDQNGSRSHEKGDLGEGDHFQ